MLPINKQYLNTNDCYIGANKPRFIVIHETDNTDRGAGALKHGQASKNGNLGTSVHYYVDDKNIVQTLEHKHGAWAVGDNGNKTTKSLYGIHNKNSIHIEICVNPESNYNKAVNNAIELVKYLMDTTGIPFSNVKRHYDATRKNCPSRIQRNKYWNTFIDRLKEGTKKQFTYGNMKPLKAIVTADVLNVRYDRGTNNKIIAKIKEGRIVELNWYEDNWVSIEGYPGKHGLGYVHTDYLRII